jgi:hypothetical protein
LPHPNQLYLHFYRCGKLFTCSNELWVLFGYLSPPQVPGHHEYQFMYSADYILDVFHCGCPDPQSNGVMAVFLHKPGHYQFLLWTSSDHQALPFYTYW